MRRAALSPAPASGADFQQQIANFLYAATHYRNSDYGFRRPKCGFQRSGDAESAGVLLIRGRGGILAFLLQRDIITGAITPPELLSSRTFRGLVAYRVTPRPVLTLNATGISW